MCNARTMELAQAPICVWGGFDRKDMHVIKGEAPPPSKARGIQGQPLTSGMCPSIPTPRNGHLWGHSFPSSARARGSATLSKIFFKFYIFF